MARYTGPKCRICKREGTKMFLKGDRCYTDKCAYDRRAFPPGDHGKMRRKPTDYSVQLREKQKIRKMYGLLEKQFRGTFDIADRQKGVTGSNLLILLEKRFDNVVYRLGFANSRTQARQLIMHGHFLINGRRSDIPSQQVRINDVVSVRETSKQSPIIQDAANVVARRGIPSWLEIDATALKGMIKMNPSRDDITFPMNEHLVVELYSK